MEFPGPKTELVTAAQVRAGQFWPSPVWFNYWLLLGQMAVALASDLEAIAGSTQALGSLRASASSVPGPKELLANGAVLAIADYPGLYAAVGSAPGGSPGAGQFALPNLDAGPGIYWFIRAVP